MDRHKGLLSPGPPSCSVCFEAVNDASERSIAKLTCGHQFHLDCIGSAFNAKGSMQCPNCRRTEHGQWLYANCVCRESFLEGPTTEGEYNLFAEVRGLQISDEQSAGHIQWCPYQGLYPRFSLEAELVDNQHTSYPHLVVNVLAGQNLEVHENLCPVVLAQMPALAHESDAQQNVRVQESSAHPQQGAWHPRHHLYSVWHSAFQHPAPLAPPSVIIGSSEDGSRWHPSENRSAMRSASSQARYHGGRRSIISASSVGNNVGSQSFSFSPHYRGQSTLPIPNRESQLRNNVPFTLRRQEAAFAFQQHPTARDRQRWAPPLSGLYGARGVLGSELPARAQLGASVPPPQSEIQAGFQVFPHHLSLEEVELEPSLYPPG